MSTLTNPYRDLLKGDLCSKVQILVSTEHKKLIERVSDKHGTPTAIVSTLYFRFVAAMKERGIVDYTQGKELEEFAAKFVIALPEELKVIKRKSQS